MKAPARLFQLSDWYGDDWDVKKPLGDELWVSPWAKAHYKLRQQEIEIEQCEFMLKQAIETEDYAEADGLKTRVERLRSLHPIRPKEANIEEALGDGNFALAAIFQRDLDAVKENLGLPKFDVGQAVAHSHRDLRGVVIDVDLQCTRGREWVHSAGCIERGCALGYPSEETELSELRSWVAQPFYTVLLDLEDMEDEEAAQSGLWKWRYPHELAAWEVNQRSKLPAPIYVAEEAIAHDPDDDRTPTHPDLNQLFDGYDTSPHRGRLYRPSPRLRLWQQERAKELQESMRRARAANISSKNPYDRML